MLGDPDMRRGRMLYRGPATGAFVPPGWAAYLQLRQLDNVPPLVSIPILYADGVTVRELWYVGQLLAINSGCGYGDTCVLGGGAQNSVEIWGYPATSDGRDEGYDLAVKGI